MNTCSGTQNGMSYSIWLIYSIVLNSNTSYPLCSGWCENQIHHLGSQSHSAKKPVTTMLTYPWKCTVLHCNHLGNTWKPLVSLWIKPVHSESETALKHYQMPPPTEGSGAYLCVRLWCWWPNTLIVTLTSAQAIIKVLLGHQHQWFPGVSQVITI